MIALLVWGVLGAAQAHPFGARFAAHYIQVEVTADRLELTYAADVPNPYVQSASSVPGADVLEAMAQELRTGLVVELDDESVPMEPTGSWEVRPTTDTHQFQWVLTAPLPSLPTSITVSNGNLPEVAAVYRSQVELEEGLVLTESSLWRMRDGEIVLDETDRWRTDERHRILELRVARTPRRWSLVAGLGALTGVALLAGLVARRRAQLSG